MDKKDQLGRYKHAMRVGATIFLLMLSLFYIYCAPEKSNPNTDQSVDTFSPSGAMQKVEHIGMVTPDIIGITVYAGYVEYGEQTSYTPQKGDRIERSDFPNRWVLRKGDYLGSLAGKDEKILHKPDKLVHADFDINLASRPSTYQISSVEDAAYSAGLTPSRIYRKSKPSDLARVKPREFEAPLKHVLYLKLHKPLLRGKTYSVIAKDGLMEKQDFVFDPARLRSEAIHVSHIGFRPDDPVKIAFLSCWLGDGGPLKYDDKLNFWVVDTNSGKDVFEGKIRLSKSRQEKNEDAYNLNYNGTDVYEMDFTDLRKAGTYRVVVEGVGCSYPFRIDDDVWRQAFFVSARGFYHMRSGIALGSPYTDYVRPRTFHPDDGVTVYASEAALMETGNSSFRPGESNFTTLVKKQTDRIVKDAWGGYMDAGDWDRRIQHLTVTRRFLELAEYFTDYYEGLSLNIPESGDGFPDIVSEALFGLDFYRRLQTPSGGIRGGIESEEHPRYGEFSWQESLKVMAYAPGIWSSYIYAGVASQAALLLKQYKSEKAGIYLESALRAMSWAENELSRDKGTKFPYQIRDARNLAAAELFRLTGDAKWNNLFLETTALTDPKVPLVLHEHHNQREAAWVYLRTEQPVISKQIKMNCYIALVREADERVALGRRTAFHWTKDAWYPPGYGAFSHPDAISLCRVHILTGDNKYLRAAILASQIGVGANPINISYTVGVGYKWPQNPLHLDSRITRQPAPNGITIAGPMAPMLSKQFDGQKLVNRYIFPDFKKWPALESYWDVFWFPMMCEFTVHDPMSKNMYVWGYLSARK